MTAHPHLAPVSDADHRRFSVQDALAVYSLAEEDSPLGHKVKHALEIVDKAIQDYGPEQVALSFNGGKDCTVLVHLFAASLLHHLSPSLPSSSSSSSASSPSSSPLPLNTIYVRCPSPFPQVEAFTSLCAARYRLALDAIEGGMKTALQGYLDRKRAIGEDIRAVLVGTRRGDPHGASLTAFAPTDSDWPSFMRVHPILDWSYSEIWQFLRHPSLTLGGGPIEWCELYNYGYTSLGSTHDTFPNPLLRKTDDPAVLGGWLPAWDLEDEAQERAGRETTVKEVLERQGKEGLMDAGGVDK
ncbi:hypothetical protein JCM21900_000202 [Sporobolomyces salmonicolor]